MRNLYLFNPINGVKTVTTYELIAGITGINKRDLASYKCRKSKIKIINSYIVDDKFTKQTLYELMLKEKIKDEVWKKIRNTRNNYEISNYGRIRRIYKNGKIRLLKPFIKHNKWLVIKIDGKEVVVHKLVANAFLNQPPNTCIYHKNNKFDNYFGNLGFCTQEELGAKFGGHANVVPVIKLDKNTLEELDFYESMAEAGKDNYISNETIRQCISGELKTAGGFKWKIDYEFLRKDVVNGN